ncbi:MAG TPA: HAD-IIIA family hydrolase [Gemmatimonadaceae bacterium]|jgi:histidinol-phosphate phosphatase family protein|nr:HAD-IIIA family hydrolase [Gemmatimonadaceae bacterium]
MAEHRRRAAALLDRDGTIISDEHYLAEPDRVALLPGAAEAIRALAGAGIPSVVCSNQSGIARGIVSLEQYRAVRLRLTRLLEDEGAALLDTFVCPHHEDFTGPCACRKPGTLMFEQAAALHALDLSRSLFVGDKHRDVAPAATFGAAGYLVRSPDTPSADVERAAQDGHVVVGSLLEAARLFLARAR